MIRRAICIGVSAFIAASCLPSLARPTFGTSAVENCRLQESSYPRRLNDHLFTGFPAISKNFPSSGTFTIAIIPVHYRDLPAEAEPLRRVRDDMATFVEYFDLQTEGRVKFQWKVTETSILLPGSQSELENMKGSADEADFARRILATVDSAVDFMGVHSVVFVLPPGSKNRGGIQLMYPMKISSLLETREGGLYNFAMAGSYFGNAVRPEWSYWAHELGHAFHLPDLYAQPWSSTAKNIRNFEAPGPFHGWDLMANQDGPSRSINMWLRWVRGWASDSQIVCKRISDLGDYQTELVPLETSSPGTKAVIIRFSDTRVLVIESRRETKFNLQNSFADEGVLVYEVDVSLGHGEIPMIPVKRMKKLSVNLGGTNPPYFDALLTEGQVLKYENLYVKVTASGKWDTIRISSAELLESSPSTTTTSTPILGTLPKEAGAAAITARRKSIVCVRGKTVRKISGVKPICPKGYKKRR
jgi:M6 family metalloprotease-like protein